MPLCTGVWICLVLVSGDNPNRHSVIISNQSFEPATLKIPVGDTVVWHNRDDRDHAIKGLNGEFQSGNIRPGRYFSKMMNQPGTFRYGCAYHPREKGVIVVEE